MDRANPWSDHNKWYYYLAFLKNHPEGDNNLWARMAFLEFNDRNKFGESFEGDDGITVAMETLHSPDPDPVDVDFTSDQWNAMADQLVAAGVNPDDVTYRDGENGTVGGADASETVREPVIPAVRDIVAPPPQTFVYPAQGRRRR